MISLENIRSLEVLTRKIEDCQAEADTAKEMYESMMGKLSIAKSELTALYTQLGIETENDAGPVAKRQYRSEEEVREIKQTIFSVFRNNPGKHFSIRELEQESGLGGLGEATFARFFYQLRDASQNSNNPIKQEGSRRHTVYWVDHQ